MTSFRFYDQSNASYDACLRYSKTFFDGFRNDRFFVTFHSDFLGPNPTMPEPKRTLYEEALCRSWARKSKLKIMSGTDVLFLANEGPKTAAACFCVLPTYKRTPVSWFQWIKIKIYGWYSKVADYFDGNPVKNLESPELTAFFRSMYADSGSEEGPEYYAKLANLSYQELAEAKYPHKDTLYINILGVRADSHGKGYGSKLLKHAIEHYKDLEGPTFKDDQGHESSGPAKTSLFPTEGKETFYNRYGFKTVSSGPALLKDEPFTHLFMQRLIKL